MPVERSDEEDRICESGEDLKLSWDRVSDFLDHLWVLVLVGIAAIAVYPLIPSEAAQEVLFWVICGCLGLGVVSQVAILVGEGIAWIASRRPKWRSAWSVRTWTSPHSAAIANEATAAKPPPGATTQN